ncbi:class I tRNA ligase family protein, partial [PVC group bacterium]|nr:class I tRNA ligase family protein [PVC group bacterium]
MGTQEKTNYKDTINLPSTNFSMKANLTMKEPEILRYWSSLNMYSALREKRKGQKKYVLHDGPPYANGHIHLGHVLNKTLKDFVVKFHSLDGFDCPYVPGWDCHGLPIEHQVVKSPGGQDVEDTLKIRKKCREYADKFIKIQKEEFERLGIFGDWEKPYLTMDTSYEAAILKSFRKLVERGFVYKKLRPIHWCCTCQTALAEAEVEHESKTSPSIFVKFRCEDDQGLKKPVYLLIWTTTPWTLPANRAVSVHDEQTYVFVDVGGEIWIMAETLVSQVAASQGEN